MYFLSWIIVGLIAGWLTGKLLTGGGYGPIMDIVMGIHPPIGDESAQAAAVMSPIASKFGGAAGIV